MSDVASLARILLVDDDADQLASLAATLRARAFAVVLANGTAMACERARGARFDLLVAPSELAEATADGSSLLDALAGVLGSAPPHVLLVRDPEAAWGENSVLRGDIDGLAARALALVSRGKPASDRPSGAPSAQAGSIGETSLLEIARALFERGRTGTLSVTTLKGAGELRFSRGELVDAVYLQLEGSKALLRLFGEIEGSFVFTPGTPLVMRRLTTPTAELLEDAPRQLEDTGRLLITFRAADGADSTFVAADGPDGFELSATARTLLARLRVPASLDTLLDEAPEPDVDILAALAELDAGGRLRRIGAGGPRLPFVASEQIDRVRALAARARAAGFAGPARVVFAGTPTRLAVLAHAALRLEEAVAPKQPPPAVPAPHEIVTLRLEDDIAIELVAVPLVPAYSPLWPMALAGAAVVVRLDEAAAELLSQACAIAELTMVDAQALVGRLDEASVEQVGSLVRAALEASEP